MCSITDDLISIINAIDIIKEVGKIMGGEGGGKPHLATAGGNDVYCLLDALIHGKKVIHSISTSFK